MPYLRRRRYSFGVLIYEIYSFGAFPYAELEDTAFMAFMVDRSAAAMHTMLPIAPSPQVLPVVRRLLHRCVVRAPADRISAEEAVELTAPVTLTNGCEPGPESQRQAPADKADELEYLELEEPAQLVGPPDACSHAPLAGSGGTYGRLSDQPRQQGAD